jgi:hypothetical protein
MRVTLAALALSVAAPAGAQEMLSMPSATAPSPGVSIPRVQTRLYAFEADERALELDLRLEYGLARAWSVSLDVPLSVAWLRGHARGEPQVALGSAAVLVERRVFKLDLSAIDTVRAALFAGAELPTGTGHARDVSLDPCAGAVATAILGRHGVDLAARATWETGAGAPTPLFVTDGPSSFANVDFGYAFRLSPSQYAETRAPALYATLEAGGALTLDGQSVTTVGPGLLLEAPTYALELGAQLPVMQSARSVVPLRWGALVGARFIL